MERVKVSIRVIGRGGVVYGASMINGSIRVIGRWSTV